MFIHGIDNCHNMVQDKNFPETFSTRLIQWYKKNFRPLPWRQTKNPYLIWISEIMLQQTTVQSVIPYYKNWIEIFPDIKTLSTAPLQKVLRTWQGLGYYQRARNLHAASKIIVKSFKGEIPKNYDVLRKLPGFGPYTTAAVLSLAYNLPYPVIDANVRRILMRLTGFEKEASARYDKILLEFLHPLLPEKNFGLFNQALMELGAKLCRPKNPACLLCPFPENCEAFSMGKQEVIPRPKKKNYKKIEAVVGLIKNKNKFLIQKRPARGLLAGLWEFPGGKIKSGETQKQALQREIREELNCEVQSADFLVTVQHAYTHFQVTLHAFECKLTQIPSLKNDCQRWVTLKSIHNYPLPSGSVKIIRFLENLKRDKEKAKYVKQ